MTDRKQALWGIEDSEDKFLLSRMCDLNQKAQTTQKIMYSKFLTPAQRELIKQRLSLYGDIEFFGGYEDADRCVASFVPTKWDTPQYPICALKITTNNKKAYSHRDYLGSLLSLGIERELTGDIVINDDGAYVFVLKDIACFVEMNLSKVANTSVKISVEDDLTKISATRQFKETAVTVSSLRLDCVLSAVAGKSRTQSASLIEEGIVSVNYNVVKNTSHQVKDGDVISLKGFGKAILSTDGALTKKGRIHLNIKKYI